MVRRKSHLRLAPGAGRRGGQTSRVTGGGRWSTSCRHRPGAHSQPDPWGPRGTRRKGSRCADSPPRVAARLWHASDRAPCCWPPDDRPRRPGRAGVQPPRGAADRGRPAVRQHRRLRVRQPGPARHRHADRQLDPVRGAGRRPELLPVRDRRAATTSTSTTTATPRPTSPTGGRSRPGTATQDTFLYNTGPVTALDDPDLNFRQTYTLEQDRATARRTTYSSRTRRSPRRSSARRRCPTTSAARPGARRIDSEAAGRVVRRPGRRPVLPRPAGLRPALRRRPVRGRRRHPRRATTSTASRSRSPRAAGRGPRRSRNPIIGVWSTTDEREGATASTARSRGSGMPLVNEVVIPIRTRTRSTPR